MGKVGEGVHDIYKERARKGGDILWHVTIKGQKELTPGIRLHMSLKVFEDHKDMDMDEVKERVKKFDIQTPDPKKLKFKTTIFTSERDGKKYYMLKMEGTDKAYEEFYNSLKHCGTVYKEFMPHITIDKGLYEKIEEEGLKPEEVEFEKLTIERGAGNTVHMFKGEMPLDAVREAIARDLDLNKRHVKAYRLPDEFLSNYLKDNPDLKKSAEEVHKKRIAYHFGDNRELSAIAWEKGIVQAYLHKGK